VVSVVSFAGASVGGAGSAVAPPPGDSDSPGFGLPDPCDEDPEPPPVPVLGGAGGGCRVGPVLGVVDGVGEVLAELAADGVGVAVDSTGRLVVVRGFGVAVVLVAGGTADVVAVRVATNRSFPPAARSRRGSASMMARAFGEARVGCGVGLGRACAGAVRSRSGNGRMALELTGPPARLTLTSPP
jgi:hypothetical protein